MKKSLFLLLSLISSAWGLLSAQPRTEADALNIAKQFLQDKYAVGQEGIRRVAPLKSVIQRAPVNKNIDSWSPFYIWNDEASNSFVIVSGDERMPSILGYAPNLFDEEKIPDALSELLSDYAAQFNVLQEQPFCLPSSSRLVSGESAEVVLKTAQWGQGNPFNRECPKGSAAGCVATAMSIIMRYHSWPLQGEGTHEYTWYGSSGPVSLSANFGKTVYDWKNMPFVYDDYTEEQGEAVARLMYHAGVSVDMYYGYSASGASTLDVKKALATYFCYDPTLFYLEADNYSQEGWLARLKQEINEGRPLLYAGTSEKAQAGHAFVVDGYQDDLLHVNWGWNGFYNGFFALGFMTPGDGLGGYNSDQIAIVNIKPRTDEAKVLSPVMLACEEGICMVTTNCRNVKKNQNFTFLIAAYSDCPDDDSYTGEYCVALVGSDGTIKEIVGENNLYKNLGAINVSCISTQDAVPGDSLYLFTRKSGTDELLPVMMESGELARVPACGNQPPTIDFTWDDPDNLLKEVFLFPGEFEGKPILGSSLHYFVRISEGDICKAVASDGSVSILTGNEEGRYFWLKDKMSIKLSLVRQSERIENLKLHVTVPGTLEHIALAACVDFDLVKSLILSGKMNDRDFLWLSKYKLLENVDLSQVEIVSSDSYPAKYLPNRSFEGFTLLKSCVLPIQLTAIGHNAFAETGLERIEIPAMVNSIGLNAFWCSYDLKEVTLKNPKPIGISWCVFTGTKREEGILHVPQGSLEAYRKANEWNMFQKIVDDIPNEIKTFCIDGIYYQSIPGSAGEKCVRVIAPPKGEFYAGDLVIPGCVDNGGVTYVVREIADLAFRDSPDLTSLSMSDSIRVIGMSAFEYCTSLKHLRLSDRIEILPSYSLGFLPSLTELNLPDSLIRIEDNAIYWNKIETLHLPKSLIYIGPGSFALMNKLWNITVDPDNTCFTIEKGLLVNIDKTKLLLRPANQPATEFRIPSSITVIGESSVSGYELRRIIIPETVIRLERNSIDSKDQLVEIYALSSIPPFADENAFGSWCTENTVLKVPVGAKTAYEQAIGWSKFKKIEETSETSVNLPEANAAKIEYTSDGLYIWADSPVDYALYALNGTLLKQGRLQKGSNKILPSSRMGLILRIGKHTYKIINRD